MSAPPSRRVRLIRLTAGLLAAGGVGLGYALRRGGAPEAAALGFLLIAAACGALAFLTRGLAARAGMVLGSVTAVMAVVSLAQHYPTAIGNLIAAVAIATGVVGSLGLFAGGRQHLDVRGPQAALSGEEEPPCDEKSSDIAAASAPSPEPLLGALVADFSAWLEAEAVQQAWDDSVVWPGFESFVRIAVGRRLGAATARIFRVSADGEALESLSGAPLTSAPRLHTRPALARQVLSSGHVYVTSGLDQDTTIAEPVDTDSNSATPGDATAAAEAVQAPDPVPPHGPRHSTWFLPLWSEKRPGALVIVRGVCLPGSHEVALANAVRNQLQLFWAHLTHLQTLHRQLRTDGQSGMLTRTELLSRLSELVRAAVRENEPVMLLAVAIEGLRGLDDSGRWSERDALVLRLGHVLRQKVRSDDLLGRFSDDRFVVVLRRLDSTLGTIVAEKLMETIRGTVLDVPETHTTEIVGAGVNQNRVRFRAGLAGTGLTAAGRTADSGERPNAAPPTPRDATSVSENSPDGQALLERALGLLEYAREQRIDIATDLMKGLPPRLARSGGQAALSPSNRPATASLATPADASEPAPASAAGSSGGAL
jgi:diguanylate cyclase (GGDEF)-like protein